MQLTNLVRQMGRNDVRLVSRDSLLMILVLYPAMNVALLRWGLPALNAWLVEQFAFDLSPYYDLFVSYMLVVMIPMLVGMVVGMLLVEEQDDQTLTALLVTPVSLGQFVGYRLVLTAVVSFLGILITVPLAPLAPISPSQLLLVAFAGAFNAPTITLAFFAITSNKVQAFGVLKVVSTVNVLPFVAYFISEPWQFLFGLLPGYWNAKAYWTAYAGSSPLFWLYLLVGVVFNLVVCWFLLGRLQRKVYGAA